MGDRIKTLLSALAVSMALNNTALADEECERNNPVNRTELTERLTEDSPSNCYLDETNPPQYIPLGNQNETAEPIAESIESAIESLEQSPEFYDKLTFGYGFGLFENIGYESAVIRLTTGINPLNNHIGYFIEFSYNASSPRSEDDASVDIGIVEIEGDSEMERHNAFFSYGERLYGLTFLRDIINLNLNQALTLSGEVAGEVTKFSMDDTGGAIQINEEIPTDIDIDFLAGMGTRFSLELQPFAFLNDSVIDRLGIGVESDANLLIDVGDLDEGAFPYYRVLFTLSYFTE